MKILSLLILLLFACSSYAFEDPRWESSVPKQSIQKKKEIREPLITVTEIHNETMSRYEEEKLKKTLSTLKESPMPLRLPDTILRVMFLPYVDSKDVLRSSYYAFLKVDDGKWLLGEYLHSPTKNPARAKVFTPLQSTLPVTTSKDKEGAKQTEQEGEQDYIERSN